MREVGQQERLIDTRVVRVTRWILATGQSTGMHRHEYDYVVVPVTGGTLTVLDAVGQSTVLHQVAGEAYARNAGIEHEVTATGSEAVVFVEIELLAIEMEERTQ